MLVSERDPLPVVTHIGTQGLVSYLIPTFILACGVLLWSIPNALIYYSLFAILLGLGSWITSNLGGFFIGMLIDVIGGALAFAWTTDADYGSSGWLHSRSPSELPSWALDVISRLGLDQAVRRAIHRASVRALEMHPVGHHVRRGLVRGAEPLAILYRQAGPAEIGRRNPGLPQVPLRGSELAVGGTGGDLSLDGHELPTGDVLGACPGGEVGDLAQQPRGGDMPAGNS